MKKIEIAKAYCDELNEKYGQVTPEALRELDEERGKQLLTWNIKKAAYEFQLIEARHWIAKICDIITEKHAKSVQRKFFHVPSKRAYFDLETLTANPDNLAEALQEFKNQYEALLARYIFLEEAKSLLRVGKEVFKEKPLIGV